MHRFDDFRYSRWIKNTNLFFQIIFSLSLVIGINYLSFKEYYRKDLTKSQTFSLSPETLAYLRQIQKPIQIIVTLQKNASSEAAKRIYNDTSPLLREYQYSTRRNGENQLSVEYVNVFQQHKRAEELAKLYNVQGDTVILVVCEGKYKALLGADLYDAKTSLFKGEQAFTSAILDVSSNEKKRVYCVQGHGELNPDSADPAKGFSSAVQMMLYRNIDVAALDLSKISQVPDDANLLIIAAPQIPFLKQEEEKLRRYLSEKNGRVVIFLEAEKEHGLDDLLYDWAIRSNNYTIFDDNPDFTSSSGDSLIRRFSKHPITQFLIDSQLTLLVGLSRPVIVDVGAGFDQQRKVTPFAFTSETSWLQKMSEYSNNKKSKEPFVRGIQSIAVCAERNVVSQLGLKISGGRIVVFGNADFVTNNRLNYFGNQFLLMNTINWCLDSDNLLNIPPRINQNFQINLSQRDLIWLGISMSIIPCSIAMIGLLIMILRKSH